jgi:pyruvate kinase
MLKGHNVPTTYYIGQGIGKYHVCGTIRIIEKVADWKDLPKDPIIVVTATNSSMLPHLTGIIGIIAEQPGLTSHAAVISRELGIPAVCDVPKATSLFHNGQRVAIDGRTGTISDIKPVDSA